MSNSAVASLSLASSVAMWFFNAAIYCRAGGGKVCKTPAKGEARSRPASPMPEESWNPGWGIVGLKGKLEASIERSFRSKEGLEAGVEVRPVPKRSGELPPETSQGSMY